MVFVCLILCDLARSLQRAVSVWPCSAGAAVPLHLAAHLHTCATSQHAGHQLLPHPIPHWGAGTLPSTAAGAAHRGGRSEFCSKIIAQFAV